MGRNRTVQKKMGKKEAQQFRQLLKLIKRFKIFSHQKNLGETRLNGYLINHLRQHDVGIENKNIISAKFVGETFRPECFLRGRGAYPLCAIECKKLTDKYAKGRWKEGLSQSLLYAHYYKAAVYVLFDYSKGGVYAQALGRGNRVESQFAEELRRIANVHIVVLRPS